MTYMEIINSGQFCSVEFIKKDGSVGRVHGRTHVKKHARGGVRTSSPKEYIMFYDIHKGYRNVNKSTIISVNGISVENYEN